MREETHLKGSWVFHYGRCCLTLHLLREAIHIIGLIGVSDSVGSHSRKFILVSIAAFPGSVDGVPIGKPTWECDTGNRGSPRSLFV